MFQAPPFLWLLYGIREVCRIANVIRKVHVGIVVKHERTATHSFVCVWIGWKNFLLIALCDK